MTPEERLKSCSVCTAREMDMQRGLVCGRTHDKPVFDDKCPDFDLDAYAERKQQERLAASLKSQPISGWMAVFLWVGLAGGSVISLGFMLSELVGNDFSFFYASMRAGTMLLLLATAFYAIYAFYKRMPNAVAIAMTYIAMTFIDGIVGVVLLLLAGDYAPIATVCRQFIWAAIWFFYLLYSPRVDELFPKASRCWGGMEKFVLTLYTIGYAAILMMGVVQPSANVILSGDSYIQQTIENSKSDMPIDVGNGVEITHVEYVDNEVRYDFRVRTVLKSGMDREQLSKFAAESKQQLMDQWAVLLMDDPFAAECCRQKKTIVFNFLDRENEFLYDFSITYEEYKDQMSGIDLKPVVGL